MCQGENFKFYIVYFRLQKGLATEDTELREKQKDTGSNHEGREGHEEKRGL